jgi:hypothetical protein
MPLQWLEQLVKWFDDYNTVYPHSALVTCSLSRGQLPGQVVIELEAAVITDWPRCRPPAQRGPTMPQWLQIVDTELA